jgi:hypothetical protein
VWQVLPLLLVATLAMPGPSRSASDVEPEPAAVSSALIATESQVFLVTPPSGWTLDSDAGRESGLDAVLYPDGSSWARAKTVMYAVGLPASEGERTLEEFIADHLDAARRRSPALTIRALDDVPMVDGRKASVRLLSGDAHGSEEAVAFIREPQAVVMIVLTSHDHASFVRSRSAFAALVASYRPLGLEPAPQP